MNGKSHVEICGHAHQLKPNIHLGHTHSSLIEITPLEHLNGIEPMGAGPSLHTPPLLHYKREASHSLSSSCSLQTTSLCPHQPAHLGNQNGPLKPIDTYLG